MKHLMGLLILAATVLSAATAYAAKRAPGQKIGVEFAEIVYDFGNVSSDSAPVVHEYVFTNTGKESVGLVSATASCGCTRVEYSKKPVPAGDKALVKVSFNPAGQRGEVNKDIKLRFRAANGKSERITLQLKGAVVPKAK